MDEFANDNSIVMDQNYQILGTIGSGSFGTVLHAIETSTNRECAVKVINKNGKKTATIQRMKQEISILKQLHHQNIVEFFGYTETNSNLYIVMEFLQFGTLKSWLALHKENITEEEASTIMRQILSAVQYLHSHEICHRDIKPENIMLSKNNDLSSLKLIDFGLSAARFDSYDESEYCGTLLYMAPEQIENKIYSKSIDIWSIGIILYMLLNHGRHPYYSKGDRKRIYVEKIKNNPYKLNYKCSYMAKTLLKKLLEVNPYWRYTADQALKHPWITRCTSDEVPETFGEYLKKREQLQKMEELALISVFLNHCAKKANGVQFINKERVDKIHEASEKKKQFQEKVKENCLKVSINDSRNSTMKGKNKMQEIASITEGNQEIKTTRLKVVKNTKETLLKTKESRNKNHKKSAPTARKPKISNPTKLVKKEEKVVGSKVESEKEVKLPLIKKETRIVKPGQLNKGNIKLYENISQSRIEKTPFKNYVGNSKHLKVLSEEKQLLYLSKKVPTVSVVPIILPSINVSRKCFFKKIGQFY